MKTKFGLAASVFFIIFSLFAAWYTGSAPAMLPEDVLALRTGTTVYGMNLAIEGKLGAQVLEKQILDAFGNSQSYYLFVWPLNKGWGFVGMDPAQQKFFSHMKEIMGGNFTTPKNVKELVEMLKANGWQTIAGASLPEYLRASIVGAASPSWLSVMHSPSMMLMMPIGPLENLNDPDWTPIYMIAPKEDA